MAKTLTVVHVQISDIKELNVIDVESDIKNFVKVYVAPAHVNASATIIGQLERRFSL